VSDELELYDIPPAFQNRLLRWLDKTGESLTITALFKDLRSTPSVPHFLVTPKDARDGSSEHRSLEHALNHAMGSRAETRYIGKKFEKRVHAWLAEHEGRIVIRGAGNEFRLTLSVPGASVEVSDEDLEVALVIAEDELELQSIEPEPETREAMTRAAPTRAARTHRMTFEDEPETVAAPTRMAETRATATKLFGGDTDRTMREAGLEPNRDYPEEFAQGARCGHLEGKGRAGQYVIGEEIRLAEEATDAQGLPRAAAREWCAGYTHGYRRAAEGSELERDYCEPWLEENSRWSRAYVNSLPDSAFLHVEPGGKKDRIGRSHPLSLRHLPYKNRSGRIDRAHLRAALSRSHQAKTKLPARVKEQAFRRAQELYRREYGEADYELAANASRLPRPRPSMRGRELPSTTELVEREEARTRREQRPFDPEERREPYARTHHFAVNRHADRDMLREVALGDTGYVLVLWDTHNVDRMGKSILGYAFYAPDEEAPLFEGEDYGASPMHAIDSDESVRGLIGFLTLRPGDTDREYFSGYTERQLDFARGDAEGLQEFGMEPEAGYEQPPLVDVR
jgi:hypothetical protein